MLALGSAFVILIATLATASQPAHGAVFTVSITADGADLGPGDGVCESAMPGCTLRAAIQEANALPDADVIELPAGVYTLTLPGRYENNALFGDLDITGDVAIVGAGMDLAAISAGGPAIGLQDRIFDIGGSVEVRITDLTIRDVFFTFPPDDCGGALRTVGNLTLEQVRLSDNVINGDGAGICNLGDLPQNTGPLINTVLPPLAG